MGNVGIQTQTDSRNRLKADFRQTFARTEQLFDLLEPAAYMERPIVLRHPINFYEGHLPAFLWNTLFRRVLKRPSLNPEFDRLFERGIDPQDLKAAADATINRWPSREAVTDYKRKIHQAFFEWLDEVDWDDERMNNRLDRQAVFLILEHEQMHQETLLYMLHQLPHHFKRKPPGLEEKANGMIPNRSIQPHMVEIPAGEAMLGAIADEFEFTWDNERPTCKVHVPAFQMDAYNITNGQYLDFVEAGGYQQRTLWTDEGWAWLQESRRTHPQFWKSSSQGWLWHGFFEDHPLPLQWPVYVTQAEAAAYARWIGKALPTEAEWHRAAFGDYGNVRPANAAMQPVGNCGFQHWSPVAVGAYPEAVSPFGIYDLQSNGWEWTSTPFAPLPGFEPSVLYPQYSADFFEGQHFLVKGASCFTATRSLRRSFRNWYYWHYPYVYAGFRCVTRNDRP